MNQKVIIKSRSYHDSAFLMRLARELKGLAGVVEAVVLMGTEMNRKLLDQAGFEDPALIQAGPMDLVLAVRAESREAVDACEQELDRLMQQAARGTASSDAERACSSIREAIELHPEINLVSVAVPGQYAAYLAGQALEQNRHVFMFSDNVEIEDELDLKERALERGLLMMGPDCGTAMLAGVGLGFMNRIRRGPIGIVGASGTGTQEVACLVHRQGLGLSHAIGTGSRDLSSRVGGRMSEFALRILEQDEQTRVIVLVAKHPDPDVAERIHQVLAALKKPAVVRYLGLAARDSTDGVIYADSLDRAAAAAVGLARGQEAGEPDVFADLSDEAREKHTGRLLGLFGGGSLASEAALILGQAGLQVEIPQHALATDLAGSGHLVVDVGDDFYTRGKPHPMVDQTTRCELIQTLGIHPDVGLLLFDLVLGDGSHPDPAPELIQAVQNSCKPAIASVTGTELDPQNADRQMELLSSAGIIVETSGARAARRAAAWLGGKLA